MSVKSSKYEFTHEIIDKCYVESYSIQATIDKVLAVHPDINERLNTNRNAIRCYIGDRFRRFKLKEIHPALSNECESAGIPIEKVKHYWHKGDNFSIFVGGEEVSVEDIREELINDMVEYAYNYPEIKRAPIKSPKLLVIDPADIHFGKYASAEETGEAYNLDIAIKRFNEGIEGIINKTLGYEFDQIVLVGGNDILHTDNPKRTTTSGTSQDTDRMWWDCFQAAKKASIQAIERLITIADVTYINCPSNHDYASGVMLSDTIASWFANCKNFKSNVGTAHRKYVKYGSNLIGVTHGDGAKEKDLPDIMKTEVKEAWASCNYAYWYTHHIHHKQRKAFLGRNSTLIEKDDIGVTIINTNAAIQEVANKVTNIEYLRSASSADSWHHRNGYQHAPKAIEAFIHDPNYGQEARITHLF